MSGALELSVMPSGLLDDPLAARLRGAGDAGPVTWRARVRDDDGRVWRAIADRPQDLPAAWVPAKSSTAMLMALGSLRPVELEIRAELADGRAAARTIRRSLVAEGVRLRRWRGTVAATLHLPAAGAPVAVAVLDATGGAEDAPAVAALAGPLLASRGVLALSVGPAARLDGADVLRDAIEQLKSVPAASRQDVRVLDVLGSQDGGAAAEPGTVVVTPPGVGVRGAGAGPQAAADRGVAWSALLRALGAHGAGEPAA